MSDERPGVISSLPSTRPHRRSDKRGGSDAAAGGPNAKAPSRKAGTKATAPARKTAAAGTKATARFGKSDAAGPATKARSGKATPAAGKARATRPAAKRPPANVRSRRPAAGTAPSARTGADSPPPRPTAPSDAPTPAARPGTLETVVQAAAELAEIGLRVGARVLRDAVSRLPRP